MMDQNYVLLLSWHLGNWEIPTSDWGKLFGPRSGWIVFAQKPEFWAPSYLKMSQWVIMNAAFHFFWLLFRLMSCSWALCGRELCTWAPPTAQTLASNDISRGKWQSLTSRMFWPNKLQIFIFIYMWISDLAEFLMQIFLITFRTFETPDKKNIIWIHSVDFIFIYFCFWFLFIYLFLTACLLFGDLHILPPHWPWCKLLSSVMIHPWARVVPYCITTFRVCLTFACVCVCLSVFVVDKTKANMFVF